MFLSIYNVRLFRRIVLAFLSSFTFHTQTHIQRIDRLQSRETMGFGVNECQISVAYLAQFEFKFLTRVRVQTSVDLFTGSGLKVYSLTQFFGGKL